MAKVKKTQHRNLGVLAAKIGHRIACLPDNDEPVRVFDAYGGDGDIWKAIIEITGRDIRVATVDREPRQRQQLSLDNIRYLTAANLDGYDVVDLDAWGMPAAQLKALSRHGYEGIIPWTCIALLGSRTDSMITATGIPKEWASVARTLMTSLSNLEESWLGYSYSLGYKDHIVAKPVSTHVYGVTGNLSHWDPQRQQDAQQAALEHLTGRV